MFCNFVAHFEGELECENFVYGWKSGTSIGISCINGNLGIIWNFVHRWQVRNDLGTSFPFSLKLEYIHNKNFICRLECIWEVWKYYGYFV